MSKKIGFKATGKVKHKGRIITSMRFTNMFVPKSVNKQTGVYNYGKDNQLPNKLLSWVLDSGTAKLAHEKRSRYIAADGFSDEKSAALVVNPKTNQTADSLMAELAPYCGYFEGFALRVRRNALNEFLVTALPFQAVRVKEDGNYTYNPTIGTDKFDSKKDITIHRFKGPEKLSEGDFAAVLKEGEILYAYHKSPDHPVYPIPRYYAGIEDIRSSSELQKFDYETVMNGFIASAILTLIGDLDDETEDARGFTERDYLEAELKKFTGDGKNREGIAGRMKLLIMTARNKEEAPQLQPFDAKVIMEASNSKRDIIDRAVCRLFEVHPSLIGFADVALLGNRAALANASEELARSVIKDQALITGAFKQIWPEMNWATTTFRPIQYVPDVLLNELTREEKRALIYYPPLKEDANSDVKLLSEKLGVGGTQSMLSMLESTTIQPPEKIALMKLVFGLTEEQAKSIVPQETKAAA